MTTVSNIGAPIPFVVIPAAVLREEYFDESDTKVLVVCVLHNYAVESLPANTCMHTYIIHVYVYMYVCNTYICMYINSITCIHTYINTYIHTYT